MRYLLLFILVLASCKKELKSIKTLNKKAKQINLIESSKKENLSDYIKDIKVVKLKTELNLIGVHKAVFYENNYYVLDKKTSQLIVFDNDGNHIRKIGKRGGGPGEYKKIRDFEIDTKNQQVLILSQYDRALYKFTLEGKFIDRIRLDIFVDGFVVSKDDTYVFMSGRSSDTFHTLTRTDNKGKIINISFPFPKDIPVKSFAFTGGLHKQGKTNYFTEATSSLIYEIQDSITPLYRFNFGKNTWKEKDRFDLNGFLREDDKFKIAYLENYYCDTEEVLIFNFFKDKFVRQGFYFKESGKVFAVPYNLEESLLYMLIHLPVGIKGNQFISSLDYELYQAIISSKKGSEFKKLNPELYENLKGFSENDNPYLLIYEVKDNK